MAQPVLVSGKRSPSQSSQTNQVSKETIMTLATLAYSDFARHTALIGGKAIAIENYNPNPHPIVVKLFNLADKAAMRLEWAIYTDELIRDGIIQERTPKHSPLGWASALGGYESINGCLCLHLLAESYLCIGKSSMPLCKVLRTPKRLYFPTIPIEVFLSIGYDCLLGHVSTVLPNESSKSKG